MNSNRTQCLIIDDEPLAIKLIRSHLEKLESFEVAGECRSALKAVEYLKRGKIDLMFLDINMPEMTGLDFLKTIPHPPYVIITTAFREYAIEGYDLDVVDFLLKPISFERFLKAINRYIDRMKSTQVKRGSNSSANHQTEHINIHDGKNTCKVPCEDVLYFEGYGEYVKIITSNKKYMVRDSMIEFEKRLPADNFMRIHKSYIVNIHKITGFSSIHVLLNKIDLPVGRFYREKVMGVLNERKF